MFERLKRGIEEVFGVPGGCVLNVGAGCLTFVLGTIVCMAFAAVVSYLFPRPFSVNDWPWYESLRERPEIGELVGEWMMDEQSVNFYTRALGYTDFVERADHVLVLNEDGTLVLKGFPRYEAQNDSRFKPSNKYGYETDFVSWWKLEEKTARHVKEESYPVGTVRPERWRYRLVWKIGDDEGDPAIYLGHDQMGVYLDMPTFCFGIDQWGCRSIHYRKLPPPVVEERAVE